MGREWLRKAGGGGGGDRSTCEKSPSPTTATTKHVKQKARKEKNNTFSGCMSAFFSLFDIQHHQFRLHHPAFLSESTINNSSRMNIDLRGVEAPRNSLESPETMVDVARSSSSSSKVKDEITKLNIPMGGIKIKTQRSRFTDYISSECSSSPGTKTPNLVARLMGLDILPEYSSPRLSADATPVINSHHRSRSLPSTPRLSATSRRSADNDYHRRLSLQVDKENFNNCKGQENEQKSRYAKEIANQVRERINRRLGTDITNTISSASNKEYRRDLNLVLLMPKKPLASLSPAHSFSLSPAHSFVQETISKAKQDRKTPNLAPPKTKKPPTSPLAPAHYNAPETAKDNQDLTQFLNSPKLRLLDINNNLTKPISHSQSLSYKDVAPKPKPMSPLRKSLLMKVEKPVKDQKMIRIASERYDSRLKKMHQQEEQFVGKISRKKSTLLPLPNHHHHVNVNVKNTTKFLSFKKEMTSQCSTTRLPQNQVSLMTMTQSPSNLNSSYNANQTHTSNFLNQPSIASTTGPFHDHFDYISKILNQCGISHTTPITAGQWHSCLHPLQPSIFHKLEKHYSSCDTSRRKMVFDLVDEFLVEMLKPYMNIKRPPDSFIMHGSELIKNLCDKIGGFHAVKCDELEDINGLIDRDIGRSTQFMLLTTVENEVDSIVKDIESDIVETLVHEMMSLVML
ncbi:probable serine/threonine-protein kinase dyrk2 isoform X1 [Tanacetum coccineum]